MSTPKHVFWESSQKTLEKTGYRIIQKLGTGNYSKVYLIKKSNDTEFACKIIKKKFAGTDFIEKFLPREINIIAIINHPNIVRVYKILESEDTIYMIMDYCRNGDLLEYIKDQGCITEEKAKYHFKQIVDAVSYLHELDIAHRDLKCENIFLMCNNQIKLGDFGFARFCTDSFGRKVLSETFCGSAAYAAPEILKGIAYNPKMYDIWALGCILYIMITATMPFNDTNLKSMVQAQLNRSIFTVTLLWPEHSLQLKNLLISLLEPDLDQRLTIKEVKQHRWLEKENSILK
ncbi:hypothetical protein ABEB36_002591 [Hypothenemus hampei]|uniref:Protein kinase domain-containing protein n=1 Tax=Hypothenemus hampei TaxID=57062 RepID=A0ABD1F699_HYPHA